MRDILFRGKRTDNGEWIYGYVNQHRGESILDCMCEQINSDDFYIYDYAAKIDTGIYGLLYKIIPETRGEYTGLTDKNGVRIFEGDIVRSVSGGYSNFIILWDNQNALWFLRAKNYTTDFYHHFSNEFEIIGNIHDNPELMEGGG